MEQASLDQGLSMRLEHLASRIESLKAQIATAEGFEKIDEIGRLDQLEHRYKDLENRMRELNREGPGFRHEMKNDLRNCPTICRARSMSSSCGSIPAITRTSARQALTTDSSRLVDRHD